MKKKLDSLSFRQKIEKDKRLGDRLGNPYNPAPGQDHSDYFQKHAIPWMVAHLTMRGTGLQVFSAIQSALLVAWCVHRHLSIPIFGTISTISFMLWDKRIRMMLWATAAMGERLVDRPRFGPASEREPTREGIYAFISSRGAESPTRVHRLKRILKEGGHTQAIRVLVWGTLILWVVLFVMELNGSREKPKKSVVHAYILAASKTHS